MPNSIYENEKRETKYTTSQEKAEILANHFEKVHSLTNSSVSIMEAIVNEVYNEYDTSEPMMNFSDQFPANFKDLPIYDDTNSNNNNNNTNNAANHHRDKFISTDELNEIIKTRNNKKSSGADKTSNYVLKKMPRNFVAVLTIIMNHIINTQYIPSAWKSGVITAICKPNKDNSLVESYRPITQLSVISKLLEKKIEMRIRSFCELKKIINPSQFGFQPGKSTEMAAG